ncbi:hypothetical protein D3C72_1682870 [compost metagenome]
MRALRFWPAGWPLASCVTVSMAPSLHSEWKRWLDAALAKMPQQPGVWTSDASLFSFRSTMLTEVAGVAFCTYRKRPSADVAMMPR